MGKFTVSGFLSEQLARVPPVLKADLTGKSVIVTGANTGLGFEAAKHFAKMNPARLIIACRNEQKAQNAAERIAKATSYKVEIQIVDFADFSSVVAFAKRLGDDPIDILVANAGVSQMEYRATKDGLEENLQINHLSTALVSFLLLPNLVRAAELHNATSRLAVVTSEMAFLGGFDDDLLARPHILSTLGTEAYCTPKVMSNRYSVSKLLNILFTRAFAQHLSPPFAAAVVPSCVNPGFCISEVRRSLPLSIRIITTVMELLIARSTEQGSRQLVWAALGPDGKDGPHVKAAMAGGYVSLAAVQEPSDFALSKEGYEVQERVWNETIDILAEIEPSVRNIVEKYLTGSN